MDRWNRIPLFDFYHPLSSLIKSYCHIATT